MMVNGGYLDILETYRNGKPLDKKHDKIISLLCSVGLMRQGYDLDLKVRTARTTDLGIGFIELDE